MRTVNTKHDVASYESLSDYKREILYDANALYDAYMSAKRGSSWKPQVQKFEMNYLINLANMQEAIRNHTYEFLPSSDFVIKERGKTRVIHGEQMPERKNMDELYNFLKGEKKHVHDQTGGRDNAESSGTERE